MNIAIVSLPRGTIGEGFVVHEVEIGVRRLKEYGMKGKKSNDFLPFVILRGMHCYFCS